MKKIKNVVKNLGMILTIAICCSVVTFTPISLIGMLNHIMYKKIETKIISMVENGAIVYLDGKEVELDNINLLEYNIDYKNGNVILSSK